MSNCLNEFFGLIEFQMNGIMKKFEIYILLSSPVDQYNI